MNLVQYPMYFIMVVSIVLSMILTLVNKLLIDQERMKEIQKRVTAYNKKLMKATKAQDKEELDQLGKEKPQIMKMQSEMMKMQMPMFASMLPFFVVFFLLRRLADNMEWGQFMALPTDPFTWPLFGAGLTWLGWYILCSLPFTSLFRKVLGVR